MVVLQACLPCAYVTIEGIFEDVKFNIVVSFSWFKDISKSNN